MTEGLAEDDCSEQIKSLITSKKKPCKNKTNKKRVNLKENRHHL